MTPVSSRLTDLKAPAALTGSSYWAPRSRQAFQKASHIAACEINSDLAQREAIWGFSTNGNHRLIAAAAEYILMITSAWSPLEQRSPVLNKITRWRPGLELRNALL